MRTQTKISPQTIQTYGDLGADLGDIEEYTETIVQSLTTATSFTGGDATGSIMDFVLITKLYARLRLVNINKGKLV